MKALKDSGNPRETTPSKSSAPSRRASGQKLEPGSKAGPDANVNEYLAAAKAKRDQAENLRRSVAQGILEATTELYQQLLSDGEKFLEHAKHLEAQAEQKLAEAAAVKAEADAYLEKSRDAAGEQAKKILARSRSNAQQESAKIMERANLEADAYLGKARMAANEQAREILTRARSKAQQESAEIIEEASLEAQRIYSEASRLEAEHQEVLARARPEGEDWDIAEDGGDQRNHDPSGGDASLLSPPEKVVDYRPQLLPEDEVLGLALGRLAKAYPCQAIVSNGVVNDVLAGYPVLVVGAPFTELEAAAFTRQCAGRILTFELVPHASDPLMWMQDIETGSIWQALNGTAIGGPLAGSVLDALPSSRYLWADWQEIYPHTEVYGG